MNRLSTDRQDKVLELLVEGCSIRSVERLTGVHRDTIMRLAVRAGQACQRLLNNRMADLTLEHLQCDEIWTFCYKKQGMVKRDELYNEEIGDQYLFIALDEKTKLIPAFRLGKRNAENTEAFLMDVAMRMRGHGPNVDNPFTMIPMDEVVASATPAPIISTDGWKPYLNAVQDAFGPGVQHGVLLKAFRTSEQPGRYGPPTLESCERRPLSPDLDPFTICTSHVERNNLTIRTFMRQFTRLALGFSKKLENLVAAAALHLAHYNYCRRHNTLKATPAMAAGIADHKWTMAELMAEAGL